MWFVILIPLILLALCLRLLLFSRKGNETRPAPVEEQPSLVVEVIALEPREPPPPETKPTIDLGLNLPRPQAPEESQASLPSYNCLPDYDPNLDLPHYQYPPLDLLDATEDPGLDTNEPAIEAAKTRLIDLLKSYHIGVQRISMTVGPAVTAYEIVPQAGTRVAQFKHLEGEISLGLGASSVRIVAPIPGKGTIGIEVPNEARTMCRLHAILSTKSFQGTACALPIAIGRAADNAPFIVDLTSLPHLLIAGATGQGKSMGLHAIIVSLLCRKHPSELKLLLMDPQKIELGLYGPIEKHFLAKLPGQEDPVVSDRKSASETLAALCVEMDNRYDLLHQAQVPDVSEYNEKFKRRLLSPLKGHQYLPYIVLVAEDFSDLMASAASELKEATIKLAERGARFGIHLIISMSGSLSDILDQRLREHFPARMAYKVTSIQQSKAILEEPGAEHLLGKGDLLFKRDGITIRVQGAFIDTQEVERITAFIGHQRGYPEAYKLPEYIDEWKMEGLDFDLAERDPLFEEAARLIVKNQLGSTSLIQRKMKLGYNRAGRLMDQLEAAGVVGPGMGSKPRDVLIKSEMELDQYL